MYNSIFIDQSLALNRRRDGENDMDFEELRNDFQDKKKSKFYETYVDDNAAPTSYGNKKNIRPSDRITKIYG